MQKINQVFNTLRRTFLMLLIAGLVSLVSFAGSSLQATAAEKDLGHQPSISDKSNFIFKSENSNKDANNAAKSQSDRANNNLTQSRSDRANQNSAKSNNERSTNKNLTKSQSDRSQKSHS